MSSPCSQYKRTLRTDVKLFRLLLEIPIQPSASSPLEVGEYREKLRGENREEKEFDALPQTLPKGGLVPRGVGVNADLGRSKDDG